MKRKITIAAVFLLAGAIVNVGVAWGCSLLFDRKTLDAGDVWPEQGLHKSARGWWDVAIWSGVGATQMEIIFIGADDRGANPQDLLRLPGWVNLDDASVDKFTEREFVEAFGWPQHSLWCEYGLVGLDGVTVHGGVGRASAGMFGAPIGAPTYVIPLRPIWSRLVVNTLFYAALLWLLICGPFTLRRVIRHHIGRCVACGYDLAHAEHGKCPECGT